MIQVGVRLALFPAILCAAPKNEKRAVPPAGWGQSILCTFFRTCGSMSMNEVLKEAFGMNEKIDSNRSRSRSVFERRGP